MATVAACYLNNTRGGLMMNRAQKLLIDLNCGDLVCNNKTPSKEAKDYLYVSTLMIKFYNQAIDDACDMILTTSEPGSHDYVERLRIDI